MRGQTPRQQRPLPCTQMRNQPRREELSEERAFNRSWQVLALAERTVCRRQCIPSPLHSASSADFIKVHLRTQFALPVGRSQQLLFIFRWVKWWAAAAAAAAALLHGNPLQRKPNCLHQTLLKLKWCGSRYISRQMETMWKASKAFKVEKESEGEG